VARRLLLYIVDQLLPNGEIGIGIDDSIERRWGRGSRARGIYRDPVRSSNGHFVKTSGLRWLALMVVVTHPLGGTILGAAIPDGPCPVGAVERDPRQAPQDAD